MMVEFLKNGDDNGAFVGRRYRIMGGGLDILSGLKCVFKGVEWCCCLGVEFFF